MELQKHTGSGKTVYQVALLQSLTQGYYDGVIKVSELRRHGDVGIGTFDGVYGGTVGSICEYDGAAPSAMFRNTFFKLSLTI